MNVRKRSGFVLVAGLLAAGVLTVSAAGATRTIATRDNFYSPKRLTVAKGTTITWRWRGQARHNVVWRRGPVRFRRSALTSNHRYVYSRTLRTRGTYTIVCTVHELSDNMKMAIKVI